MAKFGISTHRGRDVIWCLANFGRFPGKFESFALHNLKTFCKGSYGTSAGCMQAAILGGCWVGKGSFGPDSSCGNSVPLGWLRMLGSAGSLCRGAAKSSKTARSISATRLRRSAPRRRPSSCLISFRPPICTRSQPLHSPRK